MNFSAMILMNEFSNVFNIFYRFAGTWSPCMFEYYSKTAIWLKECSPKASQSISGLLVADLLSFTQNLMQTFSSILHPSEAK
jgi:hypothetical protein